MWRFKSMLQIHKKRIDSFFARMNFLHIVGFTQPNYCLPSIYFCFCKVVFYQPFVYFVEGGISLHQKINKWKIVIHSI